MLSCVFLFFKKCSKTIVFYSKNEPPKKPDWQGTGSACFKSCPCSLPSRYLLPICSLSACFLIAFYFFVLCDARVKVGAGAEACYAMLCYAMLEINVSVSVSVSVSLSVSASASVSVPVCAL